MVFAFTTIVASIASSTNKMWHPQAILMILLLLLLFMRSSFSELVGQKTKFVTSKEPLEGNCGLSFSLCPFQELGCQMESCSQQPQGRRAGWQFWHQIIFVQILTLSFPVCGFYSCVFFFFFLIHLSLSFLTGKMETITRLAFQGCCEEVEVKCLIQCTQ